jgi:hypothetical protein
MSKSDPTPTNAAESDSLAERLARHAASSAALERPQMQDDLLSASQQVADFQALLSAWRAALASPDIEQEFTEMLGTQGMNEACPHGQVKVIIPKMPDASWWLCSAGGRIAARSRR